MTAAESFASLKQFLSGDITVSIVLAARGSPGLDFQMANVQEAVAEEFHDIALTTVARLDDLDLRIYEAGYNASDHELSYIPLDDAHSRVREVVTAVSGVGRIPLFEENERFIEKLRFYATIIANDQNQQSLFFRHTSKGFEITRRSLALVFNDGTYSKVDDKTFRFDRDVDCVAWDGYLFVQHVAQFQRIFEYLDELRARAKEAIDGVIVNVPIANEAAFRAAVGGQLQMLSKIARIAGKSYLPTLSMTRMKRLINDYDLGIPVEMGPAGQERLVFQPDLENRWKLLKLLDDDFLKSDLTDTRYETNSKSRM